MPQYYEWFFSLIFFAAILGIVVSCILFFVNRNSSLSPRLLAIYLFMFSLVTLHNSLSYTNFYLNYPYMWRFTSWASFAPPVIAYLYVRSVLEQNFRLKKTDWLFLLIIPFGVFTFSKHYLSSPEEKLAVVKAFMTDRTLIAKEPESILPIGWGVAIRMILGIILLLAQFRLLAKMNKKLKSPAASNALKQNQGTIRWLFLFSSVLLIFYCNVIVAHFLLIRFSIDLAAFIVFSLFATILFICFYLFARPSILYGFQGWLQEPDISSNTMSIQDDLQVPSPKPEEEKRPTLSIEQGQFYKTKLENHFNNSHPYCKPGYKIKDLAEELSIPSYQLSAFINQEYGKNFNELINEYRVEYLSSLLKNSPEYYHFTLEGLAREAGFNSRNSFLTAVKKKTGKTPSEFFGTKPSLL